MIERERTPERLARIESVLAQHRAPRRTPRPERRSAFRRRAVGLLFVIAFAWFLVALGLSVITARGTAERIIGRAIPTLTEEDSLLALHLQTLQKQAGAATGKPVSLSWFPVVISLSPSSITGATPQALELAIDHQAAAAIYQRGQAAFSAGGSGAAASGPLLSSSWTLRQVLGLLNAKEHQRFQVLALVSGLVAALLAVIYVLQLSADSRLLGLGGGGLIAALLAGLATLLAWLLVQISGNTSSSPLGDAAWGMLSDASWTMLLLDAVVLLGSVALFLSGLGLRRLGRNRIGSEDAESRSALGPGLGADSTAMGQRPLEQWPRRRRLD